MSPTTRITPTLVGERCSTSGTATQPVSTGIDLDKSLLGTPGQHQSEQLATPARLP